MEKGGDIKVENKVKKQGGTWMEEEDVQLRAEENYKANHG